MRASPNIMRAGDVVSPADVRVLGGTERFVGDESQPGTTEEGTR